MKPKTIFDLVVRIAGLVVLLYGLAHVLYGLCGAMDLMETKYTKYNAFTGVVQVIFGLMVMRGAIPLADIAFPPADTHPNDEQSKKHEDETSSVP